MKKVVKFQYNGKDSNSTNLIQEFFVIHAIANTPSCVLKHAVNAASSIHLKSSSRERIILMPGIMVAKVV